jgi:hypothetical protein
MGDGEVSQWETSEGAPTTLLSHPSKGVASEGTATCVLQEDISQ